jgi:peptidoglycan hydrolase CwlO-like protein
MKLWVVGPAQPASVPDEKEPHWDAFEKVHISLQPAEVLAVQRVSPAATDSSRRQVAAPAAGHPPVKADTSATNVTEPVNDLRLQIRELTSANLDLRSQLKEQSDTMEKLKAELEQLRNEVKTGNSKPPSERKPSRKQPTP